jgi:tripartite-type tricarboxylate transporter receptor subunit TctC
MSLITRSVNLALSALFALSMAPAQAQTSSYPNKPIKLVVGFPAGGGTDVFTRVVAGELSKVLKENVVVENKSGANGVIGATSVAKSPADGYTLMMIVSTHIVNAFTYKDLTFDVIEDFTPLAAMASTPYVLTANKNFPANTVQELIAMAKEKPGSITYASSGNGSTPHLFQAFMNERAGIDLAHIPYRGGAPSLNDLLGGQVSLLMQSTVQSLPYIKDGQVKALAVTSAKRSDTLPNVPTIAESGIPGYDAEMWWAVLGPKGMPADVTQKLEKALIEVANSQKVSEFLSTQGASVIAAPGNELVKIMKAEHEKWKPLFVEGAIN